MLSLLIIKINADDEILANSTQFLGQLTQLHCKIMSASMVSVFNINTVAKPSLPPSSNRLHMI